jgi:hypothetical protein
MKCNFVRFAAIAVVLGCTAGTAWAFPPSNPFVLNPIGADPAYLDRTLDFQSSQASVMTETLLPNGIKLDIDWFNGDSLSNTADTKVVPVWRFSNSGPDGDGGDLDAYDGVKWLISLAPGSEPLTVKPFTQTYDSFTFYEGTQAGTGGAGTFQPAADGSVSEALIDWDDVGGGPIPAGDVSGRGDIFETGFQIFGPTLVQDSGEHRFSTLTITFVPEPASFLLLGFGVALVGMVRRGRRS